jgi:hypothetical protein
MREMREMRRKREREGERENRLEINRKSQKNIKF